jgi:Fe-S-cluster containining protein
MPNAFERELGIPQPKCCSNGSCCKGASPSTPYHQLMTRAAQGEDFARGFFSIMVPYATHAEAEAVVPGLVERTLKAAQKQEAFKSPEDIVFYQCRYQTKDNQCGVWEDRPQFCRDYPDTPFVVMAPGCAFEGWGAACKDKYSAMKEEVAQLKALKDELAALRALQNPSTPLSLSPMPFGAATAPVAFKIDSIDPYSDVNTKIDAHFCTSHNTANLSLVLSMTSLYVASPLRTFLFTRS